MIILLVRNYQNKRRETRAAVDLMHLFKFFRSHLWKSLKSFPRDIDRKEEKVLPLPLHRSRSHTIIPI